MAPDAGRPEVVASGLAFPECPRWQDGRLWLIDGSAVRTIDADGRLATFAELAAPVLLGLVVEDGVVLVGAALERKILELEAGAEPRVAADLSGHFAAPTNEFLRAPGGGLLVGSMGFDPLAGQAPRPSRLAHVRPGGPPLGVGPELLFPNGMAFAEAGTSLLVAETFASRITEIAVDADGALGEAALFADLAGARPDGIALAADGTVWFADVSTGDVVRVGRGGEVLDRRATGLAHATSCALGDGALWVTATGEMPSATPSGAAAGAVLRLGLGA
jgi:sugar lactone lactonase YvrE